MSSWNGKNVYMWIIQVFVFGRIHYSEGCVFGGVGEKKKSNEKWLYMKRWHPWVWESVCAGTCHMHSYLTVRIGKHPGEDFTQSLQLYPTADENKFVIRLEKRRDPLKRTFALSRWVTWGCAGSSAAPAGPAALPSSLTSWHWHNGLEPGRRPQRH